MKTCFRCNETKELVDFYVHKMMKDGHLNKCKECTKKDSEARRLRKMDDPEWVLAEAERHRNKSAKARALGKASKPKPETGKAWVIRNHEKKLAHGKVARAIRKGILVRQSCEKCGAANTHAHHDDYSKPLEVRWLCPKHHGETHRIYVRTTPTP